MVEGGSTKASNNRPRIIFVALGFREVGNYEAVRQFVQEARAHGCRIAIDDFGSGYSNLRHLLNLEVDNLKIDASLILDIDMDHHARAMVATIIGLAREINIRSVTAEFVHSESVLQTVRRMGIDYAQGFHIGRPAPELLAPVEQEAV